MWRRGPGDAELEWLSKEEAAPSRAADERAPMTARPDIEKRLVQALQELGLPYETVECDPDFADTAAFCAKYGYDPDVCGNTIIVASRREPIRYSACVVSGGSRLDVNKTVRSLMGVRRLSFASPEQTIALTGMMIGGVTVFALPEDLPIYVDRKLMALDYVILGSGGRSSKIKVSPQVFHELPNTQVVEGLSIE